MKRNKALKIGFIGDPHQGEKTPRSRIDLDYQETLDKKAAEVQTICKKQGCSLLIETGDLFDRPRVSEEYYQRFLRRWNFLKSNEMLIDTLNGKKNKVNAIPMVGVIGNHDIFGNSLKNFEKTSLAVLEESGFITLVDKNPLIIEQDGYKIAITGSSYSPANEKAPYEGYIVKEKLGDIHIHIVHGMGVVREVNDNIPHVDVKSFAKDTKADITIMGHDHLGFDPIEMDGKWFVNPGALIRLNSAESELNRTVQMGVIEISKEDDKVNFDIKMIPLKSAEKSDKVFDLSKKQDGIDKQNFDQKIKEAVEKVQVKSCTTIKDIVDDIAKDQNIDADIQKDLLEAFSDKMQNVPAKVKADEYKIKTLILQNFQSHEYSTFDFDDLNVLTGDTGSGKTAVMRAFSWIFENKFKDSRSLINTNKPFASATVILDNGISVTRKIERKKNGFNGYEVTYPNGNFEKLNTNAVPVIQKLLGFNYLSTDDKDKNLINLNFSKQGDGWFFIGNDTTGPERAKIIGSMYQTHIADAILKDLDLKSRGNERLLKELEKNHIENEVEIESYQKLDLLEQKIAEIEPMLDKYDNLTAKLDELKGFYEGLKTLENKCVNLDKAISHLDELLNKKTLLSNLKENIRQKEAIKEAIETRGKLRKIDKAISSLPEVDANLISETKKAISLKSKIEESKKIVDNSISSAKRINEKLTELDKVLEYRNTLSNLKEIIAKKNEINSHVESMKKLYKNLREVNEGVSVIDKKVEAVSSYFEHIKQNTQLISEINSNKALEIENKMTAVDTEIKNTENDMKKLQVKYWAMYDGLDMCPTCKQALSLEAKKNMARQRTK